MARSFFHPKSFYKGSCLYTCGLGIDLNTFCLGNVQNDVAKYIRKTS